MNRWLAAAIISLPFFVLVVLVACFSVNVPFMDQWEVAVLFEKYHSGGLGFADFFAQHNEHRLLVPRLLMFALAITSGWNVVWEMFASLALAAVSFFLLYKILTKTISRQSYRWAAAFLISLAFFSPMAWENWLWGWQVQWYLNVFGLVLALWSLSTWQAMPYKRVLIAALGAAIATYSLASGFFVWLVALPLLWFIKPLRGWLWLWIGLAIAAIGGHYIGYVDPSNSPSRHLFLQAPLAYAKYISVYLAHPLSAVSWWLVVILPLYMGTFVWALWYVIRHMRQALGSSLLPWIMLGLYACFAAASTGVTRLQLGVNQAFSSRYTTLSLLLLVTFIVIMTKVLEHIDGRKPKPTMRRLKKFVSVALSVVGILVIVGYVAGALEMRRYGTYLNKVQACARTAASRDDPCLVMLYPSPGAVWPRLEFMRSIHWGGL